MYFFMYNLGKEVLWSVSLASQPSSPSNLSASPPLAPPPSAGTASAGAASPASATASPTVTDSRRILASRPKAAERAAVRMPPQRSSPFRSTLSASLNFSFSVSTEPFNRKASGHCESTARISSAIAAASVRSCACRVHGCVEGSPC